MKSKVLLVPRNRSHKVLDRLVNDGCIVIVSNACGVCKVCRLPDDTIRMKIKYRTDQGLASMVTSVPDRPGIYLVDCIPHQVWS